MSLGGAFALTSDDSLRQTLAGTTVSGTVTDSDGTAIADATLDLRQSGTTVKTTTTASDGSYSFSGVSSGDYTVVASADGYQTKEKTISVTDSPRTVNFTLTGSFTGTVVDQSGDPVANARVAMVGYDYSNLTGTIEQKRAEAQSIREQIQDVEPPDFDQDAQLFSGSDRLQDKPTYAVAHPYSAFDAGPAPLTTSDNPPDNPDLRPPPLVHSADEPLVVTLWDPSKNGFAQDSIDEQLPGATTSGEVVIKRIDAVGDPIDTTRTSTIDTFTLTAGLIERKQHEAVVLQNPPAGFYRAHPAGQPGAAYTFAVSPDGTVDSVLQNDPFVTNLRNEAGQLTARAEALQEELNERQRAKLFTTTADANGEFAFALDEDTYKEVSIKAYREPGGLDNFQGDVPDEQDIKTFYNSTIQDIREQELSTESGRDALRQACNGASADLGAAYVPGPTQTVRPPADVTVTTYRASIPDTVGLADRQCLEADLLNSLANTSLAGSIPNLQGRLANASREDLEQIYESVQSNSLENSRVCAEMGRQVFGAVPDACNVDSDTGPEPEDVDGDGILEIENPTDTGPEYIPLAPTDGTYTNVSDDGPLSGIGDDTPPNVDGNTTAGDVTEGLTEAEIRDIVAAMQEADDTVGDTAPTQPPEVDTTNETVSVNFPVEADLSGTPGINLVARYSNGTERVLSPASQYVSVSTNTVGADIVRVQDYPLGDAASVAFELDVATTDETASETARVTNPAFGGRLPALGHVRVSASQPGVGDSVTVEPGAAPQSRAGFGGLDTAQAFAPNGSAIPTTVDGDSAQFTTVAPGPHRVEFAVSNAAGRTFNETVLVDAGQQTVNRPPTLRGQTGALGTYAVATDGLEAGRLEPAAGGNVIEADAVLPQNADVPPRVHVHENGIDAQRSHRTQFRLLRGANRQQVEQRTTVVLHTGHLSSNALIYRNGKPMVKGTGSTSLIEVTSANGSYTIMSPTTADGSVTIKTVNDPGFFESTWFSIRTTIPDIPFLSLFGHGGLLGIAIFAVRRRDPPGGRGGAGGSGGATA